MPEQRQKHKRHSRCREGAWLRAPGAQGSATEVCREKCHAAVRRPVPDVSATGLLRGRRVVVAGHCSGRESLGATIGGSRRVRARLARRAAERAVPRRAGRARLRWRQLEQTEAGERAARDDRRGPRPGPRARGSPTAPRIPPAGRPHFRVVQRPSLPHQPEQQESIAEEPEEPPPPARGSGGCELMASTRDSWRSPRQRQRYCDVGTDITVADVRSRTSPQPTCRSSGPTSFARLGTRSERSASTSAGPRCSSWREDCSASRRPPRRRRAPRHRRRRVTRFGQPWDYLSIEHYITRIKTVRLSSRGPWQLPGPEGSFSPCTHRPSPTQPSRLPVREFRVCARASPSLAPPACSRSRPR